MTIFLDTYHETREAVTGFFCFYVANTILFIVFYFEEWRHMIMPYERTGIYDY